MRVIYDTLPSKRIACIATIGVFDGLHRGHQAIIGAVQQTAHDTATVSLVITFDKSPRSFIRQFSLPNTIIPGKRTLGHLTDMQQKKNILATWGIDFLWVLKINKRFLNATPEQFIRYVFRYYIIRAFVVGDDFRFGAHGCGTQSTLWMLGKQYGFAVRVIKKLRAYRCAISSSRIRTDIVAGKIAHANILLGRSFSMRGMVVRGKRFGHRLGFPTANIYCPQYVVPAAGVYAGYVFLNKRRYLAAINIGSSPTIMVDHHIRIEVHLLHFHGNLAGRTIEVFFRARLRDEKKFPSLRLLQAAIAKDIRRITSKYCR